MTTTTTRTTTTTTNIEPIIIINKNASSTLFLSIHNKRRFSCFTLLILGTFFCKSSNAFITTSNGSGSGSGSKSNQIYFPTFTTTTTTTTQSTALFAVKKQQQKKTTTTSGGGFGGGSSSSSKKSSSSSSSSSLQGKVRSISSTGQAGSGTKPLRQAANNFDELRKQYGKECCYDIYCKSPLNDPELLWFVGKIAVRPNTPSATPQRAVISQKRIILEYSKRELRPQNFGGKYASTLELWIAPGDSEMDAVQNKVSLEKVVGSAADLIDTEFSIVDVGYNPEIYVGDEREQGGLRIKRDENGHPIKPPFEINESV